MLLVAAGVVLATGTVDIGDNEDGGANRAAERAFAKAMALRDEFYEAERAYLAASTAANRDLRRYQRDEREFTATLKRIDEEFADEWDACTRFAAVPCPEPEYPDPPAVPRFSPHTRRMRAASQDFEELRVEVTSTRPHASVADIHQQMLAAIDAIKTEIDHNADVFDEAVQAEGEEAAAAIDKGKLKTLRRDAALPAIRAMNRTAVRIAQRLDVSLRAYDLPGGRDLDSNDHSDEL